MNAKQYRHEDAVIIILTHKQSNLLKGLMIKMAGASDYKPDRDLANKIVDQINLFHQPKGELK